MKTIKSDILQTFLIIIIFNIIAIIIAVFFEISMLLLVKKANSYESITYVTVSSSAFFTNNNAIDLLIPIISYIIFFFCSFLVLTYKINSFIKEINNFNRESKDSLSNLEVNNSTYKYVELNENNNMIKEAIFKIKKNNLLEKEIVNSAMHDIKTPLHIISGYNSLNTLQGDNKYEKEINNQLNRANQVIEFSILGGERFKIQEEDVLFIIQDLIHDYTSIYFDMEFTISTKEKEVIWSVDKISFKRIIMNLIDNAIKSSLNNKVIQIGISKKQIYIKNYGEILTKEKYDEQINGKDKGLGLKIVKRYSKKNNIEITIASTDEYSKIVLSVF